MLPSSPSQKDCDINSLDSHRYPLAGTSIPASIQSFVFSQHGVSRRFSEMSPPESATTSTSLTMAPVITASSSSLQPKSVSESEPNGRKRLASPNAQQSRTNGLSKRRLTDSKPIPEGSSSNQHRQNDHNQNEAISGLDTSLNQDPLHYTDSLTASSPTVGTHPSGSEPLATESSLNIISTEHPASTKSTNITTTIVTSSSSPPTVITTTLPVSSIPSASGAAQNVPTDSLATPLSPASSPRTSAFDGQARDPVTPNSSSSSSSSSEKDSPDPDASAHSVIASNTMKEIIITNLTTPSNVPPHLTSIHDFNNVVNNFSVMPQPIKSHVLFKLLQSCDRTTISSMLRIMTNSLRHDILSRLPRELIPKILGYLDVKSLCAACTVSHSWRNMIDSSKQTWKVLLDHDGYTVEPSEVLQAQDECWDYVSWGISPTATQAEKDAHFLKYKSLPSLERPINIYKAIYRRKALILKNWMDPNSRPYHLSISGNPGDVVTCLQFDEDKIIIGSDDHTISIYETATGALRAKLKGHDNGVWALKYVGNTLVSGSTDRTVRVWDIKNKRCTHVFQDHESTVRCLDIMMPQKIGTDIHGNAIMAPKKPLIVTGSRDNTIKVWDLIEADPNKVYQEGELPVTGNQHLVHTMTGHTNSVRAISGYGELVVSGSYDNNVRVWIVETGECKWVLRGHVQRVYSVVIDPKRNRCISGSMDWLVRLWSLETGAMLYSLQGHTSLVGLVDLNRSTIVSAAADCTLCVWNPDNGSLLHMLKGHKGVISSFQHDELKVVSGSEKTLKLWNIKTGELVRDLLENMNRIWQVRFDQRRCVAVVMHNNLTTIEILDFNYDPYAPIEPNDGRGGNERHTVFYNNNNNNGNANNNNNNGDAQGPEEVEAEEEQGENEDGQEEEEGEGGQDEDEETHTESVQNEAATTDEREHPRERSTAI